MPPKADKKADAFIAGAPAAKAASDGKSVVNMRMDNDLLARIDAAAKRMGIGRTAWLHVAANRMLDGA
ncbi:MAG: hypothetical protein AB7F78_10230 [Hyphomicrobiaceae bacterium]